MLDAMSNGRGATLAVLMAALTSSASAATTVVPATSRDVSGASVDVAQIARRNHLVFVIMKAAWCPLCRAQLARLGRLLPRLKACGASFVVLAPGTTDAVAALARDTSFPYPFVAEGAVALAAAAGFATSADTLVPGFFAADGAGAVVWEQRGRGASSFGDGALLAWLGCKGSDEDVLVRADLAP